MKHFSTLSLLVCLMIFGFSEEIFSGCYRRCMKQIKKPFRDPQSCLVRLGLKKFSKYFLGKGGEIADAVIPGSLKECVEKNNKATNTLKAMDKDCLVKCKSNVYKKFRK